MDLPDGNISGPTFRFVEFDELEIGEYYFVKYRSSHQKVDQYVQVTAISQMRPQTVYYDVMHERKVDTNNWIEADYISDATKQQVDGKSAGIEAHFYVMQNANNNINGNNGNGNNGNGNNWNEVHEQAGQRPLRPGQRLLLNVNSNGTLPAFRVVTRRRRQNRRKPKTRRRRHT
jgi:hypothetical protein